ncbi:MAG: SANT/Myb-like DNA-binding domain-containing protein, partial [Novosphingobium sp.]
ADAADAADVADTAAADGLSPSSVHRGWPAHFAHTNFSPSLSMKPPHTLAAGGGMNNTYFSPPVKRTSKSIAKRSWCKSVAMMATATRKKVEREAAGMTTPIAPARVQTAPLAVPEPPAVQEAAVENVAAKPTQNAGAQQSWAPEEDELLTRLVAEHGYHWLKIAPKINRSPHSARNRWARLVRLHYSS